MGPTYAGILGFIAFTATVVRGVLHGGGLEAVMLRATLTMAVFAIMGFIAGRLAEQMVDASVRSQIESAANVTEVKTIT